jgi:SAM-dependent methyltransferase
VPTWDELFRDGAPLPTEPHPWVVESLAALGKRRRVLDLGCGAGRHLRFLAAAGHDAWGVDISPSALSLTRLDRGRPVAPRLALAEMTALPFADACFDAVVAIHVLYHGPRFEVERGVAEARRVLRPGGLLVATFLSTRTWKYGEGEALERDTFVQPRGPEAGVVHHYVNERGVGSLLADFQLRDLELEEHVDGAGERHSHWQARAVRPPAGTSSGR